MPCIDIVKSGARSSTIVFRIAVEPALAGGGLITPNELKLPIGVCWNLENGIGWFLVI